jgi:hypothetical protein
MRYFFAPAAAVLFGLALTTSGDAQGKKNPADQLPPRADEVPKYMRMLSSSNGKDRAVAAEKLGLRGMVNAADVRDAVDPLKTALEKDTVPEVRKAAARALGNISPDAEVIVPLLMRTVKTDKELQVRLAATVALGQYGPEAKAALPTLREFAGEIKDKKSQEAQTITAAIKTITARKK